MAKNPTIADVAERADVSKATVSAVINDKDTVKDSTRRRVQRAIEELNYRPRASARRRFRSPAGKSIGFVIKEAENPYYAEVVAGMRAPAQEKGYTILVSSSEGSFEAEQQIVDLLASKDVDGLIITPALDGHADLTHIFELKRRNVPFVLLEEVRGVQANLVDVDNVAASGKATGHLIGLGHERIVHFAGPAYSTHSEERIEGTRRAFSESKLIFSEEIVIEAGVHLKDGYETGLAYFRSLTPEDRPTAVTCYNDLIAVGLLRALQELGLGVPEEVSIIGHDDVELLEYLSPPLTTIGSPKAEMGRRAAEMLIRQIEASEVLPVEKVYLDGELVLRASVAPPPAVPA